MGATTKIQWTDRTFNPWRGCTKIAEGCKFCYAETMSKRNQGTLGIWGPNGTRVIASESMWREPAKWNKAVEKAGVRHRVFCASLADVFEDWNGHVLNSRGEVIADCENCGFSGIVGSIPGAGNCCEECLSGAIATGTLDGTRRRLFRLIDSTPNLDWLLLTKRPENIRLMWTWSKVHGHVSQNEGDGYRYDHRDNVWLGTSVSTQADAERNIPKLLKCRDLASVLFLSAEPLIGPVDLTQLNNGGGEIYNALAATVTTHRGHSFKTSDTIPIDWVIVGGESGPHARPCRETWVRDLVRQCSDHGVPVFVKQLGSNAETGFGVNRKLNLKDKKGGEPDEWPEDLRVREFPSVVLS